MSEVPVDAAEALADASADAADIPAGTSADAPVPDAADTSVDPAEALLAALAAARHVAGATDYARGGRSGRLQATVEARRKDDAVVLREEGRWRGADAALAVRDATRWTRAGSGAVDVEHLRRGADAPVRLGRVRRRGPGRWTTTSPHVCGPDRYQVRVEPAGDVVRLTWRVEGPTKRGRVRRAYRPRASALGDPAPGPRGAAGAESDTGRRRTPP